ncbi:MAG: CpXC domain-containing protein [Methanocalculaceae archaeon]|jgi:hypothetical protein|nr:CpXC domain-containing protein [Methanocalculaceae archaeon]
MITDEDLIICPGCYQEQKITVSPSVNVTTDQDLRRMVISGDIFLFTCEKCGYTEFAGYPFVYEDKETNGGFLINFKPECLDHKVSIDGGAAILLASDEAASTGLRSVLFAADTLIHTDYMRLTT